MKKQISIAASLIAALVWKAPVTPFCPTTRSKIAGGSYGAGSVWFLLASLS